MGICSKPTPVELASRQDLFVSDPEHIDSENWDFSSEETQYLLHNLHAYPARFIPQIPKRAIERWSQPGDVVLDPFCGSGTTLLEGLLARRSSVGIDNNGVAILISRAKTQSYTAPDLSALETLVTRVYGWLAGADLDFVRAAEQNAPVYENREKWFTAEAIRELAALRMALRELQPKPRVLGLAVFSHLIVQASRQDSDTRYAAVDRDYRPRWVWESWTRKMRVVLERARENSKLLNKKSAELFCADTRNLEMLKDRSVALIVTSPPYLNAYDYHKYHRHRLHWIDADISLARDAEIGKHDTFTRPRATPDRYFTDMGQCFGEWHRVLRQEGHAFVVIGDAIVSGEFVPVADNFIELASTHGLKFKKRWVRQLEVNKKSFNQGARIKREHLLLFRNC